MVASCVGLSRFPLDARGHADDDRPALVFLFFHFFSAVTSRDDILLGLLLDHHFLQNLLKRGLELEWSLQCRVGLVAAATNLIEHVDERNVIEEYAFFINLLGG